MTFMAVIKAWIAEIGAKVVAGAAIVLGLIFIHKRKKAQAADQAVEVERARVSAEVAKDEQYTREEADEIEEALYNLPDDDLRKRMRDAATD